MWLGNRKRTDWVHIVTRMTQGGGLHQSSLVGLIAALHVYHDPAILDRFTMLDKR
jgi:DNA-binding helix-hairpin-helix protein with protein kinase domain